MEGNKPDFVGMEFEEMPSVLKNDEDVDGVLFLDDGNVLHPVPVGRNVPSDGAEGKGYGVWSWNGDKESPTLTPSINIADFHISVRDGEVV